MLRRTHSIALFLGLAACDSSSPAQHDLAPTDDAAVALPDLASGTPFTWTGMFDASEVDGNAVPDGGFVSIDGTVCIIFPASLAACHDETGGAFSLSLPGAALGATESFAATVNSPGYLSHTIFATTENMTTDLGLETKSFEQSGQILMADDQASAFLGAGGISYPSTTTGYVQVFLHDPTAPGIGIAGGTATIAGSTKTAYGDANRKLDASLTSTSSSGQIVIAGVPSGAFTVTVDVPGKTCTPTYDLFFPGSGTNKLAAVVAAGTLADDVEFSCQ